ncbi:MAG: alpha/beta hydrolase [Acidimicrobiales bacterium]|nr:alpha/beta hydrolase [Acidimicrobiales bacterium]
MTIDEGWEPIEVRPAPGSDEVDPVAVDHPAGRSTVRHLAMATDPIIGPGPDLDDMVDVTLPRLARHEILLADGHQVGVAVCGRGVPLVVVHGFSAEGILYAQTLSRLVDLGFKVIAIDTAGHGGTLGLPTGAQSMASYAQLLGRVLDHLGVREAVLAGHSMGGRLVTELAANEPERAIAVILLDAIVGDTWDRLVNVARMFPPLLFGIGVSLVVDTASTVPWFRDPRQAAKLGRLVAPTMAAHLRRPWRLMGPAASILRSPGTKWMLDKLGKERIPVFAVHGDRDFAVPLATSKAAARRARGDLVVVRKASHSWLLKDPETLPAIMHALMRGRLGTAVLKAKLDRGVDPAGATDDEVEAALYAPDALVLELTPRQRVHDTEDLHRPPRYRWQLLPARDPRD